MNRQLAPGSSTRRLQRFERLESRRLLAGDMTNSDNPLDVNDDSEVTAADALAVINYLHRMQRAGESESPGVSNSNGETIYPDASGNGSVAASDALMVINALAEGEDNGPSLQDADFSIHFDTGSNPRIQFSGQNTDVLVTSPQSGQLRFEAQGMDRTISIKHDLRIEASGSNNRWLFDGAIVPDDLFVKFSGSNNAVRLSGAHVGDDLIFRGGSGSDAVILDDGASVREDVVIKAKKGDDLVAMVDAAIGDDFIYHAYDGMDALCGTSSSIGDDAIVRMGDHNDRVSLQDIRVRDVADIEGDRNSDSLAVDNVTARRYRPDDFESQGDLENCQQLIAELYANFGAAMGGNGNGDDEDDNPAAATA